MYGVSWKLRYELGQSDTTVANEMGARNGVLLADFIREGNALRRYNPDLT